MKEDERAIFKKKKCPKGICRHPEAVLLQKFLQGLIS